MQNANNVTKMMLDQVGPEKKPEVWNFLKSVHSAISSNVRLEPAQSSLLEAMLSDVVCGTKLPKDRLNRILLALQIATWANGAHVASQRP